MLKFINIFTVSVIIIILIVLYFNLFTKGNIHKYKRTKLYLWDNSIIAITEYKEATNRTSYRIEYRKIKHKNWTYLTLKYNEKPSVFLSNKNKLVVIVKSGNGWNAQVRLSVNGPYKVKFFKSKEEAMQAYITERMRKTIAEPEFRH